jgi:hypothetical protein
VTFPAWPFRPSGHPVLDDIAPPRPPPTQIGGHPESAAALQHVEHVKHDPRAPDRATDGPAQWPLRRTFELRFVERPDADATPSSVLQNSSFLSIAPLQPINLAANASLISHASRSLSPSPGASDIGVDA